jgi:hypothetical protein
MTNNLELIKLLKQSRSEYKNYLNGGKDDALAEAGELLWECLKANIAQVTNAKIDNNNALKAAAASMGEQFNQLFFHCYHFHSWYSGGGVPNNFEAEEKIYLESFKSVEKFVNNKRSSQRTKERELENAAEAI